MERISQFLGVVISSVSIAAIGAGITIYHDLGVMQNDLQHIKQNTDMMRADNALIIKNHELRIRDLELRLAKKMRDERKKS